MEIENKHIPLAQLFCGIFPAELYTSEEIHFHFLQFSTRSDA